MRRTWGSLDAWIFRPGAPAMVATQPPLDRLIEHGFDIACGDWRGAELTMPSEHPWTQPLAQALRAGHAQIAELLSGDLERTRLPGPDSASRES